MLYVVLSIVSGILSVGISIYYRLQEIKTKTIIFWKHIGFQLLLLVGSLLVFGEFFSHITIEFSFFTLSWFWIFFLFSSLSYYAWQVFFEYKTDQKLFAPKEELEAYLEKLENDRDDF